MKNIFPPININNSSTIHDKSNIFVPIVSQGKISCPPRHSINMNQTKLPTQVDQAHTSIKSSYHYRFNSSSASNLTITQLMVHLSQIIQNKGNHGNFAWFIMNQSNRLTQKQSRKICMIHHESIKSSNIKTIMRTLHDPWWISQIVPT